MISVGERILDQIERCLLLMTVANGYSITLSADKIFRGVIDKSQVTSFPTAFYELGTEDMDMGGSSKQEFEENMLTGIIGIHFQTDSGQGNISTVGERIRYDLKGFVNQYKKFKPNVLELRLKTVSTEPIPEIKGWYVTQSGKPIDYGQNTGLILVAFDIKYELFPNQQVVTP